MITFTIITELQKKGFEKENELQVKYKDYSKSKLKKELK